MHDGIKKCPRACAHDDQIISGYVGESFLVRLSLFYLQCYLFLTMTKPKEIIDDIAQLAGGAAGLIGSASQQIRDDIKTRVEDVADRMDLVPREDLDRVEALLHKALDDQKDMLARIETLEAKK